jgi:1,4-dihydroxy-2-naphthoate octaprenyltransferase
MYFLEVHCMEEQDVKNVRLEYWEKSRRWWYNLYLFVGVGINLLLYFTKPYGFDPSGSIFWGSFFGLAIPLGTMFLGTYIHKKVIGI